MTNKDLRKLYEKRLHDKRQLKSRRQSSLEKKPKIFEELLNDIFKQNPQLDLKVQEHKILQVWSEIVGEVVAKASKPIKLQKNVLAVYVTDSLWMQQLIFLKIEILKKYKKRFPKIWVRDIFFTQKKPDSLEFELDSLGT